MTVLGDDIILAYFEFVDAINKRRFADALQICTVNGQLFSLNILLQLLGVQLFHEAGVGNTLAGILVVNDAVCIVHTMSSLIIIVPGVEGEADKLVIFVNHLIIAADSTHIRMAQILARFVDHFLDIVVHALCCLRIFLRENRIFIVIAVALVDCGLLRSRRTRCYCHRQK